MEIKKINFKSGFQIFVAKLKEFLDVELVYYASSLSFYTIFSIIPLLIIIFSIFTKLPSFDDFYIDIQNFVFEHILPAHKEVIKEYLDIFLLNTSKVEFIGVIYVVITSIMFFQNYEYIVNRMFKSKVRSFWSSLTLYWTMITLLPVVLIASIYLSLHFYHVLEIHGYTFGGASLKIPYPFFMIWFLFFISYRISITVPIKNRIVLLASFVGAISWEFAKTGFVYYVLYNTTYLSIYGSFAILMFFFLWIYLSWIIFLYGLKLAHVLSDKQEAKA
ncbi:putative membrane protein [Thiovulum sp. ES]|nr:putative membrane protein [Thiovulum sp. ES]